MVRLCTGLEMAALPGLSFNPRVYGASDLGRFNFFTVGGSFGHRNFTFCLF